ncbi:MAG TPA: carbon-nitrogen hydrolase family protein [bacterium]|nr:carbon-nitrogen hydrolase family protein [bacterium]
MRVTVCQMRHEPHLMETDWNRLVQHVGNESSELVLLPEMPFSSWFPKDREFRIDEWEKAVRTHEVWIRRLKALHPAAVISTRPVNRGVKRHNQCFASLPGRIIEIHKKRYLPDEPGFWEASWYHPGPRRFKPADLPGCRIGILICTEIWFFQHARHYASMGVQLLAHPRATGRDTLDKWLAGGRAAAVVSGAFCLSSNRICETESPDLGGMGWIIDPDGRVLGTTSQTKPFLTLDLDLKSADRAKSTYPRYVIE